MKQTAALRSPYPYFGGKSAVASIVWERFGDVRNFVEPFFGSGAMTLARPHWPFEETRIETVNDKDGFVSNFWRAMQADPEAVAKWADWPVNEADLHARHFWLVNSEHVKNLLPRLKEDPDAYDAKVAGWWVWGACQWIGSGWCAHPEWQQRPHLGDAGMGIHRPSQQRPHLGDAGMGIHRPSQQRPHLGDAGMGIHRPSQQLPHLGDAGMGNGTWQNKNELYSYFAVLAERMKRVRVCCGDWSRVCGPTPTVKQGLTGVFLDPPYNADAGRDESLYAVEDLNVSNDVRKWCKEVGDDKRLRICLAGYTGEGHEELESLGWSVFEWKARGGYGSQSTDFALNGRENAKKERLWFSPHCLRVDRVQETQRELFADAE